LWVECTRPTAPYFAETEQTFHPHVVPGIDFSNDPLLQGIVFTQPSIEPTKTTHRKHNNHTAETNMDVVIILIHLVEVVLTKPKLVKEDFQVSTSV
jgi:hypothetical protein